MGWSGQLVRPITKHLLLKSKPMDGLCFLPSLAMKTRWGPSARTWLGNMTLPSPRQATCLNLLFSHLSSPGWLQCLLPGSPPARLTWPVSSTFSALAPDSSWQTRRANSYYYFWDLFFSICWGGLFAQIEFAHGIEIFWINLQASNMKLLYSFFHTVSHSRHRWCLLQIEEV